MGDLTPPLGYRRRYLPYTMPMLNQFWKREFGDSPQVAHLLRQSFSERWVRFHSFPDCQRYPNDGLEMETLLARHNTILSALAVNRRELQVLTTNYSPGVAPESPDELIVKLEIGSKHWCSIPMHELEGDTDRNYWHIFTATVEWSPNIFDDLLRLVANDQLRNVMILDPTQSWLYHPYDGGADVILKSSVERNRLAEDYKNWLSPLPSGM